MIGLTAKVFGARVVVALVSALAGTLLGISYQMRSTGTFFNNLAHVSVLLAVFSLVAVPAYKAHQI